MLLKFDGRAPITFPSETDIRSSVASLTPAGNGFLVLEKSPSVYMQAAVCDDGWFDVEYRAGSITEHYEGSHRIDDRLLNELLISFLDGSDRWQERINWKKLVLQS